jgi:pimeloyl-ACP methyl ester carboxylesterase
MMMATSRTAVLQYWRENLLRDLNPILAALTVPVLDVRAISASDPDPEGARAAYVASMAGLNLPPGSRTVFFYNTGHFVQEDRTALLEQAIVAFTQDKAVTDERPTPLLLAAVPARFGHVEKAGRGSIPMILMPCLGCDWRAFDEFMARNATRYRMFAVTWPGMRSTPLPAVSRSWDRTPLWDNLVAAIRKLIEEENLSKPVIVGQCGDGDRFARLRRGRGMGSVEHTRTDGAPSRFLPRHVDDVAERTRPALLGRVAAH